MQVGNLGTQLTQQRVSSSARGPELISPLCASWEEDVRARIQAEPLRPAESSTRWITCLLSLTCSSLNRNSNGTYLGQPFWRLSPNNTAQSLMQALSHYYPCSHSRHPGFHISSDRWEWVSQLKTAAIYWQLHQVDQRRDNSSAKVPHKSVSQPGCPINPAKPAVSSVLLLGQLPSSMNGTI